MERILLKVGLPQIAGDLQGELLILRQGVLADELNDLLELVFLVEDVDRPLSDLRPVLGDVLLEPWIELISIQRVGFVPVDRREMPAFGEIRVERPERFDNSQCVLGDRLGEVTARRRHGTDHGDRAGRSVGVLEEAGSLVELAEPRREVGRVALLAGHLFESG